MITKIIKFVHRWRRQIFFNCLGMLIGLNMWRLPEPWLIFVLGSLCGLVLGTGITTFYFFKKGMIK